VEVSASQPNHRLSPIKQVAIAILTVNTCKYKNLIIFDSLPHFLRLIGAL
jgi:hypothetical protein